jgi:DNA repair protein RadC
VTLYVRRGNGRYSVADVNQITRAAAELLKRSLHGEPAFGSPDRASAFLQTRLRPLEHELFCMLVLDNRNRLIEFVELFRGTIDGASVHPREVVKEVLKLNGAAVIFAHNHPSGVAEPSQADEVITRRLKSALALIDVRVLDHLVIGDSTVSFAERGLL